jgi:hypothetical protein
MGRDSKQLKLVRETVRDLTGRELENAAGGNALGASELPTCLCSSIPCGGLPSLQRNSCIALTGGICG